MISSLEIHKKLPFPALIVFRVDLYPKEYFPDLIAKASLELIDS